MKNEWEKVFSSRELYQVELMATVLNNNEIESRILNNKNSMIPSIGDIELHVPAEKIEKARKILEI